jgi:hypothetical protein
MHSHMFHQPVLHKLFLSVSCTDNDRNSAIMAIEQAATLAITLQSIQTLCCPRIRAAKLIYSNHIHLASGNTLINIRVFLGRAGL